MIVYNPIWATQPRLIKLSTANQKRQLVGMLSSIKNLVYLCWKSRKNKQSSTQITAMNCIFRDPSPTSLTTKLNIVE